MPLTLAGNEAQTGCGYITKILEMLRQNATEDCSGFNSLVDVLDAIFDADLEEELDITGEEQDAVRIMNLHKAKGLEAPVVFLSHPAKGPIYLRPSYKRTSQSRGLFRYKKTNRRVLVKIIGRPLNWDKYELEKKNTECRRNPSFICRGNKSKNLLFISASEKFNSKTRGTAA